MNARIEFGPAPIDYLKGSWRQHIGHLWKVALLSETAIGLHGGWSLECRFHEGKPFPGLEAEGLQVASPQARPARPLASY